MIAQHNWENRQEWDRDRGELEIKIIRNVIDCGEKCSARKCDAAAVWEYVVGRVDKPYGEEIYFCEDHADEERAFELYTCAG